MNRIKITVFFITLLSVVFAQASGPKIEIENKVHNFGKVKEGTFVGHDYLIKNSGDAVLKLTKIKASCGCTTTQPEKSELQPGESTFLHVEFDTRRRQGLEKKHVYVFSNDKQKPQVRLSFTANVIKKSEEEKLNEDIAYIKIEKKLVKLGDIKKGDTKLFEFPVKNIGKKELVIKAVRSTCSCISTEITNKRIAPGEEAILKGEFDSNGRNGKISRTLTFITNDPYKSYYNVTIFANVTD